MKLTWSITIAIAIMFSSALLLGKQTSAVASPGSMAPGVNLGRDLVPSRSQELFRQWQERIEKEAQNLIQKSSRASSSEPLLRTNVEPQVELERLPQLQPDDRTHQ